jgi:hypothetical protein
MSDELDIINLDDYEDHLSQMYYAQELFERSLGYDFDNMDTEDRIEFIKNTALAINAEVLEALDETGWKPWTTSWHINEAKYKAELVDVFHFFLCMMLAVNMSTAELFEGYRAKMAINIRRQQEKYDGKNKCPQCKRAYDDSAVDCEKSTNGYYCDETRMLYVDEKRS